MIPTIGYISLIIAFALTCLQIIPKFKAVRLATDLIFAGTAIALVCLITSYAVSDFSVLNVYNNSHTIKPFIYKITGTWGNHEGSLLLLVSIFSAYNFAFSKISKLGENPTDSIIRLQNIIGIGLYAFIIFTSNPFERIHPTPEDGLGLNPLLQDIGLAIHPPLLYVGYIGFSLGISFAAYILIKGEVDRKIFGTLRKWTLFSWAFLTLGVGMGSWWAYRELGWGGFWFWDPVENVSLMPWLAGTALLHSLFVTEKRGELTIWTILLAILTFCVSLIGIFLVRSGILTSVHAFAQDPTRGMFILAFFAIITNASLILFAIRANKLKSAGDFEPLSKESFFLFNNLIFTIACATVLLGTIYPIFLDILTDTKISVGAPYFNSTMPYITLPILILAALAPAIKWKKDTFANFKSDIIIPFIIAVITALACYFIPDKKSAIAIVSVSFSAYLIASMLQRGWQKMKKSGKISTSFYSMAGAHIGVAIAVIGITICSIYGIEKEEIIKLDDHISIAGYDIKMDSMSIGANKNYLTRIGVFSINKDSNEIAHLHPEVRYYPVRQMNTTESDIYYSILSNLYVAMGDSDSSGGFAVRVYYKPAVNLIWLGCLIMFMSGMVGILGRKK